ACLFDAAPARAAAALHAEQDERVHFTGSSGHLVSEAFYFTAPEGNGIELYIDRDRSEWRYENGALQMATLYLDPNAFLQRYLDEKVLASVARTAGKVGHVHLQVGDIPT